MYILNGYLIDNYIIIRDVFGLNTAVFNERPYSGELRTLRILFFVV